MKKHIETGAMALSTTRSVVRRYSWTLILRSIVCVLVLNVLDASLFRLAMPAVVATLVAFLIILLVICVIGAILSYCRFLLMRMVLRRSDWQIISGCSRAVFVGPVPVAQVVVADFGGDGSLIVDYVGPLRFSRRLPGEMLPANLLVARWRRVCVYSTLDGSSPSFGVRVRPKFLRSLLLNVVPHV